MKIDAVPDYRVSLEELQEKWTGCTRCPLGERRETTDEVQVFGTGPIGKIMLVAGGPGETEAYQGVPFSGASGRVLHSILDTLDMEDDVYITNLVVCRSCSQMYDGQGVPVFQRDGVTPRWKDEDPTLLSIEPCMPRLLQEIYSVDPVLIVALGKVASETLLGHPVAVTRDRGEIEAMELPGASYEAVYTEKRHQWVRKLVDGKFVVPTKRSSVIYQVLVTLHPAYVARNMDDERPSPIGPFLTAVEDLKFARGIYRMYKELIDEK